MSIGIWQLVLILLIIFIVFGAGRLPKVMNEIGMGIRSLKEGLKPTASKVKSKRVKNKTKNVN